MRTYSTLALGLLLAVISLQPASADTNSVEAALAKIGCSVYAGTSENPKHNEIGNELYLSGIQNLFEFLEAVESGEISNTELRSNVPMIVSWNLGGLSISRDFAAGKIAGKIEQNAADDFLKYNDLDDREKFGERRDIDLWPIVAADYFEQGNCALLERSHSITLREFADTE